jgi:hypothetical protein
MTRSVAGGVLVATAVALATPGASWTKPGVTAAELGRDDQECREAATYYRRRILPRGGTIQRWLEVDEGYYHACMRSRGYAWAGPGPEPVEQPRAPQRPY